MNSHVKLAHTSLEQYGWTVEEAAQTYAWKADEEEDTCGIVSSEAGWICTRAQGHSGPHVAHRPYNPGDRRYPHTDRVTVLEIWGPSDEDFFTLLEELR